MIDYSLYLVTDRLLACERSLVDIVAAAVAGGVTCVQLREKACQTREFIEQARALKQLLAPLGIPLIINDRIDIALAVGADGVHLGQRDMSLADAARVSNGALLLGISAESLADAVKAEQEGADYIGISPVFATLTKPDTAPALGIAGIKAIRNAVKLPLVGIGGIDQHNCASVIAAGADGVAVVSAIMSADDPEQAARRLRQHTLFARQRRSS